jgi:hypothetical protein
MKDKLREFIGDGQDSWFRGALVVIALSVILWTLIFSIECAIGVFMPRMITGAVAALSGVAIGTWVRNLTN